MATLSGGTRIKVELEKIVKQLKNASTVDVGFLPDKVYPDGTNVAYIAAIQEFGGTFDHPGGTRYITDAVVGKGDAAHLGTRFVGQDFKGETKTTGAHKITIPSRPFFRTTIAKHSAEWGPQLGKLVVDNGYNTKKALDAMGQVVAGEIREGIIDMNSPPNAPSTIRRKGSAKPLVDTGEMLRSVDAAVK